MSTTKDSRRRNWQFILYPDSAPGNWYEIFKSFHVSMFISPLHDRDVTALGVPKKPHRHVLVMFGSNKSEEQARQICDAVSGCWCPVGSWMPGGNLPDCMVADLRLAARYHLHLDDADKFRYCSADEIIIGCEDFNEIITSGKDCDEALGLIEDLINEYTLIYYHELVDFCKEKRPELLHTIRTHTLHIKTYQRSLQYSLHL